MKYNRVILFLLFLFIIPILFSCDKEVDVIKSTDGIYINKDEYLKNKNMVIDINNAIFRESKLDELSGVFSKYKDRIDSGIYNKYFDLKKSNEVKSLYTYDFVLSNYKLISNYNEINKEDNTITFILVNSVTKDYSYIYDDSSEVESTVPVIYKFNIETNKLVDFNLYIE